MNCVRIHGVLTVLRDVTFYVLVIYYFHGEPQININADMIDDRSRQLLIHSENMNDKDGSFHQTAELQIKCIKCKSKCYYPPQSCEQLELYNWFVSYLPTQDGGGERIEFIEIYCGKCCRFSLWKNTLRGPAGDFVPPNEH